MAAACQPHKLCCRPLPRASLFDAWVKLIDTRPASPRTRKRFADHEENPDEQRACRFPAPLARALSRRDRVGRRHRHQPGARTGAGRLRPQPGFGGARLSRRHDAVRRTGQAHPRLRRRAAKGIRRQEGQPRRAAAAQHAVLSGGLLRHPAGRRHGGELQPALHRARAKPYRCQFTRRADRHARPQAIVRQGRGAGERRARQDHHRLPFPRRPAADEEDPLLGGQAQGSERSAQIRGRCESAALFRADRSRPRA